MFNLDFLSLRFDNLNYSVPEGDPLRYIFRTYDAAAGVGWKGAHFTKRFQLRGS